MTAVPPPVAGNWHMHGLAAQLHETLTIAASVYATPRALEPTVRLTGGTSPSKAVRGLRMFARSLTPRWQIIAATGLIGTGLALPGAAQTLNCPTAQAVHGPGVLKETRVQIAETGSLLASGDSVNRAPEVVSDLRRRYPGVGDAELANYLVTAYCPVVAKLDGLSVAEQQARVDQFARQASVAVYGH